MDERRVFFRVGNKNARNIYFVDPRRPELGDVHVGVMFEPAHGHLAVAALNTFYRNDVDAAEFKAKFEAARQQPAHLIVSEIAPVWMEHVLTWHTADAPADAPGVEVPMYQRTEFGGLSGEFRSHSREIPPPVDGALEGHRG